MRTLKSLMLVNVLWLGAGVSAEGMRFEDVSKAHGMRLQPKAKHPDKRIAKGQKNFTNVHAKGYFSAIQDARFVDSNGDGRLDVFLLNNPSNLWNRHWHGQNGGGFKEVPPEDIDSGSLLDAYRLLSLDFDGDGAQDVLGCRSTNGITNRPGGKGTLRFILHPDNDPRKGVFAFSRSYLWASSMTQLYSDFDNDGVVDVATGAERSYRRLRDSNSRLNGGMMNGKRWELDRTTIPVPVGVQAVAADFDNDGYVDVLGRGYFKTTQLSLNKGSRTFENATKRSGLETLPSGGPVAVADFNNDGLLDIFATGKLGKGGGTRLFLNKGKGVFVDATKNSGLISKNGKGFRGNFGTASVADFDNDGLVDLFFCEAKANRLFRNQGDGRFKELTSSSGIVKGASNESCNDCADFDGDGLVDLLAISDTQGLALMRNATRNRNGWLKVRVRGPAGNCEAAGARVSVYKNGMAGNKKGLLGYREKIFSTGFRMPNELHFGLGANASCDVRVQFPGGKTVVKKGVKKGSTVSISAE